MNVFTKWWQNRVSSIEDIARAELTEQANETANAMKSRVHSRSGATANSVRVERGPSVRGQPRVVIKAGGPLTTKEVRKGSGVTYDYTRAEEFGTADIVANPFFFNSLRERKKATLRAVRQRVQAALQSGWI